MVWDASQHEGVIKPEGDFWLFAYGSLMWNPEINYIDSAPARLFGYHRRLCLWSVAYRGTVEQPGLVMGLDKGGSCLGRAFLISENDADDAIALLNEREMVTGAYKSILAPVILKGRGKVPAVSLIARRNHLQYVPRVPVDEVANIVRSAKGRRGCNREYVLNTASHLEQMGIHDQMLAGIRSRLLGG